MTDAPALPGDAVALTHGTRMPLLGFGTWQIKGKDAVRATSAALEAGYRHLDTATIYGNEGEVGRALAESGVPRDEVFVTTKCPPDRAGRELDTLKREPRPAADRPRGPLADPLARCGSTNLDLWRAFVEARESGLAREIGVSNFDAELIDEVSQGTGAAPAVNQIEWSPLLYDAGVVAAHQARGVVLEGYSALRGGTLDHPAIVEIAERLGRTPAQVIIRWHLEHRDRGDPQVRQPGAHPVQRGRRRVQPDLGRPGDPRHPGWPLTPPARARHLC